MAFDRKEYAKQWREANKEKCREYAKNYMREKRNDDEWKKAQADDRKARNETRLESFVSNTLTNARSRAKKHKLDINIDAKYLTKLILECNGKCSATGVNLSTKYNCPFKASLDRIDSNKGYIKGNVRIVATMFNYMKQDYTDEQFALVAKSFLQHNGLSK